MNQKYRTDILNKTNQVYSPYIQLLEAKKKVFGYKYDLIKNEKHNKKISPGNTANFSATKQGKSFSSEKIKMAKPHGSKKKRVYTESAEDKMHESLFIPPKNYNINSTHTHQASKSLFYPETYLEKSPPKDQPFHSLMRGSSEKKKKSFTKKHSKVKVSQSLHNYYELNELSITDIDSLISLIDGCVSEANQYISYLSEKIENFQSEILQLKKCLQQKQHHLKVAQIDREMKNQTISAKNIELNDLKQQIEHLSAQDNKKLSNFEVKRLVEIVQKLNEENNQLKKKIQVLSEQCERSSKKKDSKDIFNQIHSQIDILNISIDKEEKKRSEIEKKTKYIKSKHS